MTTAAVQPVNADLLAPIDLTAASRSRLRLRATATIGLRFFETAIAVEFDDPEAAASLGKRYRWFASDEAPVLRVTALRDADGAIFFVSGGRAYRWNGALQTAHFEYLADAVLDEAYFRNTSAKLCFHAATLALGNVAFALTASSEGGKTTTAVACSRRGMALYSDEWCVLDGGSVRPFPRALNLREGSLQLLSAECDEHPVTARIRARPATPWRNVDFAELFGDTVVPEPRPLAALFFIEGRAARPLVEPLSAAQALSRLLTSPPRSTSRGQEIVSRALDTLESVRMYRLTLGAPDATALLLHEVVQDVSLGKD